MEGINKKYNLEIEVLTPLSIGAGAEKDWVRGIDFVVENGKLYKLNIKKMLKCGVTVDDLSALFSSKNEKGLKAKFAGKLEQVSDAIIPITVQSDNDVKSFVKNQLSGKPVLAGSSVKGSLRSVLFQYLGGNSNNGKEVFGSSTEGDEFMRFIKLSDAEFDGSSLVNTKIFNLRGSGRNWQGGWKHGNSFSDGNFKQTGFNTIYECLMPAQKSKATLMLSASIYDKYVSEKKRHHIKAEKKYPILHNDISTLFGIINEHTKNYLQKEKAFFEKYATDRTNVIISSIDSLLNQVPTDNSCCIMKMSAGSGFHSITGDWQFSNDYYNGKLDRKFRGEKDDYNSEEDFRKAKTAFRQELATTGEILPKSRKIAVWDNNFSLMGFVKLTPESVIKKQAEAAEKTRVEHEKRQEEFNNRINEIERLVTIEQYEEALRLYKETSEMFSEFSQNRIDIESLKLNVSVIQMRRNSEIFQQEAEMQRKSDNAVPLAEKIANAQKLPTLCGNVKTWMKLNGIDALDADNLQVIYGKVKEIFSQMKPRERDGMKNLGKDLTNLVGPEIAFQWFSEIGSSIR